MSSLAAPEPLSQRPPLEVCPRSSGKRSVASQFPRPRKFGEQESFGQMATQLDTMKAPTCFTWAAHRDTVQSYDHRSFRSGVLRSMSSLSFKLNTGCQRKET